MTKIQITESSEKKASGASDSSTIQTKKPNQRKKTTANKAAKANKSTKNAKTTKNSNESKKAVRKIAINAVSSSATHSTLQKSTTLSRRYVKKPEVKTASRKSITIVSNHSADKDHEKQSKAAERARILAEKRADIERQKAEKRARIEKEKAEHAAELARIKAEKEARAAERRAQAARAKAARESTIAKTRAKKQAKAAERARILAEKRALAEQEKLAKKAAKSAKSSKPTKPVKVTNKSSASPDDRTLKNATRSLGSIASENQPTEIQHTFKRKHRGRRIILALICSGATVGALVAFVHFNIPDLSVRVAAMQTGIEATYPTFIPRNYSLSNVTSDKNGVVTMYFNGPDNSSFTLSEEQSTWDSTALLNNYVKKNYPSDYATLREQGITIYTRGEKSSWVNGGLLYKIETTGKPLTKEQIRNIATSL